MTKSLKLGHRHCSFKSTAFALLLGTALLGCGEESANEVDNTVSALSFPFPRQISQSWQSPVYANTSYPANWVMCANDEVLVGYFAGSPSYGLCGRPQDGSGNHGTVATFSISTSWSNVCNGSNGPFCKNTLFAGTSSYMHACPNQYYIQGIALASSGEEIKCVRFGNIPYSSVPTAEAGGGSGQNSSEVYGLSTPNMHVCRETEGMVGFHRNSNIFGCVR
jgi:hypothetical protein